MGPADTPISNTYPTVSYGSAGSNSAGFTQPYKQNSGVTRGTQIIANTDGSKVTLGKIANTNSFGIAFYDPNGNLLSTMVGATTTEYDASGNMRVANGLLSTGEYGTAYYDTSGNLIQKIVGGTTSYYDPVNGNVNVMIEGKKPDATYGFAVAATGKNVADGYS